MAHIKIRARTENFLDLAQKIKQKFSDEYWEMTLIQENEGTCLIELDSYGTADEIDDWLPTESIRSIGFDVHVLSYGSSMSPAKSILCMNGLVYSMPFDVETDELMTGIGFDIRGQRYGDPNEKAVKKFKKAAIDLNTEQLRAFYK
jgi:hypothetical protein